MTAEEPPVPGERSHAPTQLHQPGGVSDIGEDDVVLSRNEASGIEAYPRPDRDSAAHSHGLMEFREHGGAAADFLCHDDQSDCVAGQPELIQVSLDSSRDIHAGAAFADDQDSALLA
ncbi:hypothetical protein [Amycolatopsis circi]|uniref:hypothetical protein n=1 Tax=Amycolatopsis circi TaxID=871959 RepID=UPI000E241D57|nr:hypothetical protein [Amycolatopsis circi]